MKSNVNRSVVFVRVGLWFCVIAAVVVIVYAVVVMRVAQSDKAMAEERTSRSTGLVEPNVKHLASQFSDSHGRMIADPPSSDQLLDPQTLVVSHTISSDGDSPSINWAQFDAFLEKQTGRKVIDDKFTNSASDLARIKEGKITILALHAADAPFIVNNYGYVPAAALGDEGSGANGNHLDIIVKPQSPLSKLADLKDHTLVCTVPSSITGHRAAIALLARNESLKPYIHYQIVWSMKQKDSILGVTNGPFQAAAVSDDKLQSMLKAKTVSTSEYTIIFTSEVIPRTTIGWLYNLKPELAEKIRSAILAYRPDAVNDDPDNTDDSNAKPLHFIPIDYKKDFQLVRDIDDRFDPRLDARAMEKKNATTQP